MSASSRPQPAVFNSVRPQQIQGGNRREGPVEGGKAPRRRVFVSVAEQQRDS